MEDMAITPDGSQVVTASGWPYYHQVFTIADLSAAGQYNTSSYPNAVAISANGIVFAGVTVHYGPAVYVFIPGNATAVRSLSLPADQPDQADDLGTAGLAVTPDGRYLFAVTLGVYGSTPVLNIVPNP